MDTATYTPPVDKLLTYGSLEDEVSSQWPDYLALGLGPEDIPELIRMATDRELRNLEGEDEDENDVSFWAPLHAVRALGQLHAEEAIEPLLPLFNDPDDEWMEEELVKVYGMLGPAAIPALARYLADTSHNEYARSYASDAILEISDRYPETRSESVAALTHQLESFEENDYALNAFLIGDLVHLKAVEAAPLIEEAFAADRVDEFVIDWDYVQVKLGLKEPEEMPQSRSSISSRLLASPFVGENTYIPSSVIPGKHSVKKKAKNKMAKQSRKKNRRRK